MRALVQRVSSASVEVNGTIVGQIGPGMLVLVGVTRGDTEDHTVRLAQRLLGLRMFADSNGKMNLDLEKSGGSILVISQFTLCADTTRGRRPSFDAAAPPDVASFLYMRLLEVLAGSGRPVQAGVFGAHMQVSLVNDGPVTFLVEI